LRATTPTIRTHSVELLAQSRNQNVDCPVEGFRRASPRPVKDLIPRQHPAWALYETDEELEFTACQDHRLALVHRQAARADINNKVIEAETTICVLRGHRPRSPHDSPRAGEQFARAEGFGEVVVSPQFEADHAINLVTFAVRIKMGSVSFVQSRRQIAKPSSPGNI
jgi:hypothetical protein